MRTPECGEEALKPEEAFCVTHILETVMMNYNRYMSFLADCISESKPV